MVAGDVWWQGGTFHPYVYRGGVANDLWRTSGGGTFQIDGGTIAPIALNTDYDVLSAPISGDQWEVLRSLVGFVDATAPAVDDDNLWRMEIDPVNPPTYWKLIAK